MPYTDDNISLNDWAADYQAQHGHPPMIIGRVYSALGQDCRLVKILFNDSAYQAAVQRVELDHSGALWNLRYEQLIWKDEVKELPPSTIRVNLGRFYAHNIYVEVATTDEAEIMRLRFKDLVNRLNRWYTGPQIVSE